MATKRTIDQSQSDTLNETPAARFAIEPRGVEIIKKGKYRVFNGTDYETIYLQTSSEQVIESELKKFVSQTEKNVWNSKADGTHNHDTRYYQKTETFNQTEINAALATKANSTHGHNVNDITTDLNKMFVSKTEKDRWNDTYTKAEVNTSVDALNTKINTNESSNAAAHTKLETDYKAADTGLNTKITGVDTKLDQAVIDLTELINTGGDANATLAARVDKIEKTEIPGIKGSITSMDAKFTTLTTDLNTNKADKTQVAADIDSAKASLTTLINTKADKTYVDTNLALKANVADTYNKTDVDGKLALKVDTTTLTTELAKKVDVTKFNSDMALKADKSYTDTQLNLKADKTTMQTALDGKANTIHTHTVSQVTGLGNVATLNTGTNAGNVPVLDAGGKLAVSTIPKIAINETYTATNEADAMTKTVENGDVVILSSVAAGSPVAYICIDSTKTVFVDKFKPLQSVGDTISKAEVYTQLNLKLDKTTFTAFQATNTDAIALKADKATTFTKDEVTTALGLKVDKVAGKGLSTNDFTTPLLTKLNGIADNANNYVHPTADGSLHVPATGTTNNGRVLMAGTTAGSMTWTSLNPTHITTTTTARFVTDAQITDWNSKATGTHNHDSVYRKISDSYSNTQTDSLIAKMATVISTTQPAPGVQATGAVWIEVVA